MGIVNVQHNCRDGKCGATGRRYTRQERTNTKVEESYIVHSDDTRYIINTHALHNAALLRKVLPRSLTVPLPYIDPTEREAEHRKMAASLRVAQDQRRAKEAESRRERQRAAAATKSSAVAATKPSVTTAIEASAAAAPSIEGLAGSARMGPDAVVVRPRKRARPNSGTNRPCQEELEEETVPGGSDSGAMTENPSR